MIQRIQSVYLAVGTLLNASIMFLSFYMARIDNGAVHTMFNLLAASNFLSAILNALMVALPAVTIFQFTKRTLQVKLTWVSIYISLAFLLFMGYRWFAFTREYPKAIGNFGPGFLMPVAAIVCFWLAVVAIKKDENLVKSVDRLR
jgi:Domain of unknown function (DUF4293)